VRSSESLVQALRKIDVAASMPARSSYGVTADGMPKDQLPLVAEWMMLRTYPEHLQDKCG